jgi:hypothetical protein
MGPDLYSYRQLHANLADKLGNQEFLEDIYDLATDLRGYEQQSAAELLMQRLGRRLRNAPDEEPASYFPAGG